MIVMTSLPPNALPQRRRGIVPVVVLAVLACMIAAVVVGLAGPAPVFKEGGPVELATAAGLFALSAGLAVLIARGALAATFWHLPVLLFLMAGREMDWDKSLLSGGMLKSRFYLDPGPLWEKAIGFCVVVLLLWCMVRTLRHGWRPCLAALRHGAGWPWATGAGIVLVVIAKAIDGIDRKLAPWGIVVPPDVVDIAGKSEEVMELAFALALVWALWLWRSGDRT